MQYQLCLQYLEEMQLNNVFVDDLVVIDDEIDEVFWMDKIPVNMIQKDNKVLLKVKNTHTQYVPKIGNASVSLNTKTTP